MIKTAVILAGGKSRRFGSPKGLVKINDKPLVAYLDDEIRKAGITDIYLATDDFKNFEPFGLTLIPDEFKECGPLAGIHSVLNKIATDSILVLSCDLPRITSKELKKLIESAQSNPADFVYATTQSREHVLCSVISKAVLPDLVKALQENKLSVFDFMMSVDHHPVFFDDEKPFLNLNMPGDLDMVGEIPFDIEHTAEIPVIRYQKGEGFIEINDPVVRECLVNVWLNETEIAVIHAVNRDIDDLAVGFLFTECLINDINSIKAVDVNDKLHSVFVTTSEELPRSHSSLVRTVSPGCGQVLFSVRPGYASNFEHVDSDHKVPAENIVMLMNCLLKASKLFQSTGGVHIAALSDGTRMISMADDLGRHNCVDKIIGRELRKPLVPHEKRMILTSGRISVDIVTKAIRFNAPFLVSHSAPSEGAVQLARKYGITMAGFARGTRFNIYSFPERIEVKKSEENSSG